jgi:hypothetical protein
MGDISTWVILLFIVSAFVFAVYLGAAPNSRLSRGLDAFWETPAIKQFGKFLRRTFWVFTYRHARHRGYSGLLQSGWYPRGCCRKLPSHGRSDRARGWCGTSSVVGTCRAREILLGALRNPRYQSAHTRGRLHQPAQLNDLGKGGVKK